MRYLSITEVLELHDRIISSSGGSRGIRDLRAMLSNTNIARKLNITPSAVSRFVARGRQEPISAEIEAMLF